MLTINDINNEWLNEVKDYIIDSTIREYNVDWDFLASQVNNLEGYSSDRKDALVFDVKNMGYADYDEIDKAFKKLGHDDLDAQDFSEDIYEICRFDNETIFHDIEDYLEVPFYAMGRMGGHWGVLCEDVCDKDLVDVEINEKELWKYIEKNYDLNDYDDIWDIDCEYVGRYADENCFNFVADKDFVKHLNNAWDEIKKQSDYMSTYDYAEYIAERLIEDNFLESKKSARKSIKESVDKTFFDWMCDKDFFKGISKQITKKEKCQFDFYKTLDSYAWIITYKEGESLHIYMNKRTNDIFIHVNKNGKSGKDFKFPQLTFDDSVDELLDIIIRYVQGNFDSSWYESKNSAKIHEGRKVDTFIIYYEERNGETDGYEVHGVQQLKDALKWLHSDKIDVVKITVYKRGKDFDNNHDDVTEYYSWKESKKLARKSIKEERYNVELSDYSGSIVDEETFDKKIKESADDIITVKEFCFWGHSGNIVEIWTIDGVLCDSFEVRNVGKSEYKNYEIHGWDCAKNTVIIYIKK